MEKYHIVIPTYKRVSKLKRCLDSIFNSGVDLTTIKIFVYHDNNDIESLKECEEYYNSITNCKEFLNASILHKQFKAFGVWNYHTRMKILNNSNCKGIFYVCDDIEFQKNSIDNAINTLESNFKDLDGVVGLNQMNIAEGPGKSVNAMGLIGRKFIDRYKGGTIFCIDYKSFHADAEVGNYARSVNKFKYGIDAKILHYHPAHIKSEMDETHNIVRAPGIKEYDRETWNMRQERKLLWGKDFEVVRYEDVSII
jgi:hypothetical protein